METTKYNYAKVIQQMYSNSYGWEDVSEHKANSTGTAIDRKSLQFEVGEYKLLGYPTRVVFRRYLN